MLIRKCLLKCQNHNLSNVSNLKFTRQNSILCIISVNSYIEDVPFTVRTKKPPRTMLHVRCVPFLTCISRERQKRPIYSTRIFHIAKYAKHFGIRS